MGGVCLGGLLVGLGLKLVSATRLLRRLDDLLPDASRWPAWAELETSLRHVRLVVGLRPVSDTLDKPWHTWLSLWLVAGFP